MTTGFVFDDAFLLHDTGAGHPECPQRLSRTMAHLRALPVYDTLKHYAATPAEPQWIAANHAAAYLTRAQRVCAAGDTFLDNADVPVSGASYRTALQAAGACMTLADGVMQGEIDNGFVLARPPGHHAEHAQAMGFCMFNNVAILARYLQQQHGLDKILILDWDVHHGNGTQHAFEADPSVLFISAHQYPFYPGTGAYSETGSGRGQGATLNCPVPAGSNDKDYEALFMEKILPCIDQFGPEFIIISAGFDAHKADPLGQVRLSTACYGWMTRRVMELADKHAGGRIVSALEGGYNLNVLPRCVEQHLLALNQDSGQDAAGR